MVTKDIVRERILRLAMDGMSLRTIHYSELTDDLELPRSTGNWKNHPLCLIFDELDREDNLRKQPPVTALVVNERSGIPGPGFFDTYYRLSGFGKKCTLDDDAKREMHRSIVSQLQSLT